MEYLRIFAEEYGLEKVISSLADNPNVQGAVLTLDDWWLTAWRSEESGAIDEWAARLRWCWHHWGPAADLFISGDLEMGVKPWIPQRAPNLGWRPPHWEELCRMLGRDENTLPVRLIVCLLPPGGSEDVSIPELPRLRLPVTFEVRPIARLSSNHRLTARPLVGGVSVGTGPREYGTLGGIVEDTAGVRYGMTCSHVLQPATSVEQPALHDDAQATAIGTTETSISLQQCPGTGPCNPYTGAHHIAAVDSTLVDLGSGIKADLEILSIGSLAGVVSKNSMTTGQEVTFVGRTSGTRIAEVGGLAVFYRLRLGKKAYCFRDLFEIRWRSWVRSLLGPVVQAGDSGAWVCTETAQGPGWCGQVIGEDRRIGYAAYADSTIAAWSAAGKQLRVA